MYYDMRLVICTCAALMYDTLQITFSNFLYFMQIQKS
jgi:hypothetical protein